MISSVASRVAGLGALTAAGQLLIVGSLPAYSNIFDPGTYGEYVVFVGVFTVVSVFAGVRYDSAIVLPRNEAVAAALSVLVMSIALTVSGLIAAATLLASATGLMPGHWAPIASHFGYGLAAATFVGALQRCFSGWCIRGRRFLSMGFGQFILCLMTVVAQLSFARMMAQLPALIWGYVAALTVQTACLSGSAARIPFARSTLRQSIRSVRLAARKYRRFPIYMVGYALASSARDRLIQVVLGIGAGAAVVGRFGLAYRVVFAPNSLVYSAVSPVFFSIASRGDRVTVGRFAAGLVEAAFVMLIVPYVAFAIEAPALTDAVLSEKWHGTGPYLQALAGPALVLAATCWLDRAFDSFRRQRVAFSLEASFTLISVISVGCLSKVIDPVSVAWAFGALALVYYWTYFLLTFVACGFPLQDFRRTCRNGFVVICVVSAGACAAQLAGSFAARAVFYAAAMAIAIAVWVWYLGGADTMRLLLQSRFGGEGRLD
jgi:O-antigen/teichoic acid export membrane protein